MSNNQSATAYPDTNSPKDPGNVSPIASKKAGQCETLDEVRSEINRLDSAMLSILAERFTFVERAWQLKSDPSQARVPWRIDAIIERIRKLAAESGFPPNIAEHIWREMIECFIAYEKNMLEKSHDARNDASSGKDKTDHEQE